MSCGSIAASLPLFAGGDLDARAAEGVRAHLRDCAACRAEAARLQQATLRLRRFAAAPGAGVDEAMFEALHRDILGRVAASAEPMRPRWWPWTVAAAALLTVGFWWGLGLAEDDGGVFVRPPLATPAAFEPAIVVPWAGPRVPLRPLSDDRPWQADDAGDGSGMLGRDRLRGLVDESMVLPPRQPRDR
jgi:hypothetical protein